VEKKQELFDLVDKLKLKSQLVKTPQKLDVNYTIYGQMLLEMNVNMV
jgi:hypothetical protein